MIRKLVPGISLIILVTLLVLMLLGHQGQIRGEASFKKSGQKAGISFQKARDVLSPQTMAKPQFKAPRNTAQIIRLPKGEGIGARIITKSLPDKPYEISLRFTTSSLVEEGDVCVLNFQARLISSSSDSGHGYMYCFFEANSPPWPKALQQIISLPREWARIQIPFKADRDYAAQKSRLGLGFGFPPQAIEVKDLRLQNLGSEVSISEIQTLPKSFYAGQEPEAAWRKSAARRINTCRKADLIISVTDSKGNPVPEAAVSVEMTRHSFGFGSSVDALPLISDSPEARLYQKTVEKLYNKVVFENELKWPIWHKSKHNPDQGRYSQKALWQAIEWLHQRHIDIRGHWLVHNVLKENVLKGHNQTSLRKEISRHLQEETSALKGHVVEWDAINHLVGWGKRLAEVMGRDYFVDLLHEIRKLDPEASLYVNEDQIMAGGDIDLRTRRDEYYEFIKYLLDHGAPLQGIGFMGHFTGTSLTSPEKVYQELERFARFGLDLQVTELDVDVFSEDLQAAYLRDFMTMCFSHPKVVGIVLWGFHEKLHWRPKAALYRADSSIKPAGEVWKDLVFNQWWTKEQGNTDHKGLYKTRGFHGHYQVSISWKGQTEQRETTLPPSGRTLHVTFKE